MFIVKPCQGLKYKKTTHQNSITFFPALEEVVREIDGSIPKIDWDFEGIHYFDNGPLSVQYLLVLDALNFCFWPGTNQ